MLELTDAQSEPSDNLDEAEVQLMLARITAPTPNIKHDDEEEGGEDEDEDWAEFRRGFKASTSFVRLPI